MQRSHDGVKSHLPECDGKSLVTRLAICHFALQRPPIPLQASSMHPGVQDCLSTTLKSHDKITIGSKSSAEVLRMEGVHRHLKEISGRPAYRKHHAPSDGGLHRVRAADALPRIGG